MSRKKKRTIFVLSAAAVLIIGMMGFVLGFKTREVKVEGNQFYTDDEIKEMILDVPIANNTILARFIKTEEKIKDADMLDRITIQRQGAGTLVLRVREKQLIGYVEFQGQCVNFDRQGIVQVITEAPVEGVPLVDGLEIKQVEKKQELQGVNTKKLNTILSVGKMLEKNDQKPDRLEFNSMNQLVLYYGDIEVRMGNDENMEEKMNRLVGILPQLAGMKGVLHMENINEDSKNVVFDRDTGETGTEGEPEEDGSSDTSGYEDSSGDSLDGEDSLSRDRSDGEASGESEGNDSSYGEETEGEPYGGEGAGDNLEDGDSYGEDISGGDSYDEDSYGNGDGQDPDLEYSDGSDSSEW